MILLGALVLCGVSLWFAVQHKLIEGVDEQLAAGVKGVEAILGGEDASRGPEESREELTEYARAAPGGALLRVRDQEGRELLPASLLTQQLSAPQPGFSTILLAGTRYRIYSALMSTKGHTVVIESGAALAPVDLMLSQFSALLLIAIPFVVAIAFGGGYWISRHALAPVDEITRAAQRISLENLSDRLPVPRGGDELQRLSETWNQMLARLDSAFQRVANITADASHELRTPVAVIRTTAELALRRHREPAEYQRALDDILSEATRMTELTENLLTLARADSVQFRLRFEEVNLADVVCLTVRQLAPAADARQVALHAAAGAAHIRGDSAALRRLLLILIDNALKHTPAGGSVQVTAHGDAAHVTLSVIDTGEGIAESDLPHIFERFYRADKSRNRENGAGLGLAIAQSIAHAHGTRISVDSKPGAGSCFSAVFPAA